MVAHVQAARAGSAASSAVTCTLPGNPTAGNLLVAFVTCFQNFSAVNGNWTDSGITRTDANSGVCRVLYRYVQVGDTAASVAAMATCNTNFWNVSVCEISGVTGVWADDLEQSANGGSTGSPFSTSTLTTVGINALAVCGVFCAQAGSPTGGFEAGWDERVAGTTASSYGGGIATDDYATAGSSVDLTVTWAHSFTAVWILLIFAEEAPAVGARVTQAAALVGYQAGATVDARITQAALLVAVHVTPPPRITQAALLVGYGADATVDARITQAAAIVGVRTQRPGCLTEECDLWRIERTDGTVLRFTSHNRAVTWQGESYTPCGSLSASALQLAAELSSQDNFDIGGILTDAGVNEVDLWAHKYDGAEVKVYRVTWDGASGNLVTAGTAGRTQFGDTSYTIEVVTAGERLSQRALVQPVTPTCRYKFGDERCTLDKEIFRIGGAVAAAASVNTFTQAHRRIFTATAFSPVFAADHFTLGQLTWVTGANAGITVDIKSQDAALQFTLEEPMPYAIQIGDTFTIVPGDDQTFDTCVNKFANGINFGGFPHLRGRDDLNKTPDTPDE